MPSTWINYRICLSRQSPHMKFSFLGPDGRRDSMRAGNSASSRRRKRMAACSRRLTASAATTFVYHDDGPSVL